MSFTTAAEVSNTTGITDGCDVLNYRPKEPCDKLVIAAAETAVAESFGNICRQAGSEFTSWGSMSPEQQTAVRLIVYNSLDDTELGIELASEPLYTAPEFKLSPLPIQQGQAAA